MQIRLEGIEIGIARFSCQAISGLLWILDVSPGMKSLRVFRVSVSYPLA